MANSDEGGAHILDQIARTVGCWEMPQTPHEQRSYVEEATEEVPPRFSNDLLSTIKGMQLAQTFCPEAAPPPPGISTVVQRLVELAETMTHGTLHETTVRTTDTHVVLKLRMDRGSLMASAGRAWYEAHSADAWYGAPSDDTPNAWCAFSDTNPQYAPDD